LLLEIIFLKYISKAEYPNKPEVAVLSIIVDLNCQNIKMLKEKNKEDEGSMI